MHRHVSMADAMSMPRIRPSQWLVLGVILALHALILLWHPQSSVQHGAPSAERRSWLWLLPDLSMAKHDAELAGSARVSSQRTSGKPVPAAPLQSTELKQTGHSAPITLPQLEDGPTHASSVDELPSNAPAKPARLNLALPRNWSAPSPAANGVVATQGRPASTPSLEAVLSQALGNGARSEERIDGNHIRVRSDGHCIDLERSRVDTLGLGDAATQLRPWQARPC